MAGQRIDVLGENQRGVIYAYIYICPFNGWVLWKNDWSGIEGSVGRFKDCCRFRTSSDHFDCHGNHWTYKDCDSSASDYWSRFIIFKKVMVCIRSLAVVALYRWWSGTCRLFGCIFH